MIKHVHVLSRRAMIEMARRRELPANAIVISIVGSMQDSVFNPREGLLELKFDDCTPQNIEEFEVCFSKEQASRVADFLLKYQESVFNHILYVHCEAGIARSGAVGEFTQRVAGIPYDAFKAGNPRINPNPYVLMLLMRELRERGLA